MYHLRDALSLALTLAGIPIVPAVPVAMLQLVPLAVPKLDDPPVPNTRALDGYWTRVEGCCT